MSRTLNRGERPTAVKGRQSNPQARQIPSDADFALALSDTLSGIQAENLNNPIENAALINNFRALINEANTPQKHLKNSLEALNEAAAEMAECEAEEELVLADEHVKRVIDLQVEVEWRKSVLEALRERAVRGEALANPLALYYEGVEAKRAAWAAKTGRQKYASSEAYKAFRVRVWEAQGGDGVRPSAKSFIPAEDGDDINDSDDDDLEIGGTGTHEFKCPLCICVLTNPVKSTVCIHAYCRSCFSDYFTQNGGQTSLGCPTAGCPKFLTKASIKVDETFSNRLKAYTRREKRREEAGDEEDEEEEDGDEQMEDVKPSQAGPRRTQSKATQSRRRKVVVDDDSD